MSLITDEILEQMDKKKTILAWSFYDWANSAFATTVMAGFLPDFFRNYYAASLASEDITFYLGLANSIASLIIVFLAPFLGAVADKMAGKKRLLLFFAIQGILMTGLLVIVAEGYWVWALILYILGTVGFSGANTFYDSLLPAVASEKKIDYASSLGFSLGYIGGGLLFAGNVVMFLLMDDWVLAVKLSFLSVAVWWAVFTVPIMLIVKEPPVEKDVTFGEAIRGGARQLRDTLADVRHLKYVALFLVGFWFYIDGVDTIIRMAVDYGGSLGFDSQVLIVALLLTQFVAFPATLLYNVFAKKVGVKRALLVAILAYACITVLGYFMNQEWHFYALACLIGCFQGGIQALSRSLYSRLIPETKSAQFFGFLNMLGKFAAVIGPILMGGVTKLTGSNRLGILSILILFAIGGFILWLVDIEEGERMAKEFLGKKDLVKLKREFESESTGD